MTDRMVRWVVVLVLLGVMAVAHAGGRVRRQVTYHADEHHEIDEENDHQSVSPVTKKPLPAQVAYPGDLSSFYTTDSPNNSQNDASNGSTSYIHRNNQDEPQQRNRRRRSTYDQRQNSKSGVGMKNPLRHGKSSGSKDILPMESRLHSSYHKPSVSIMNDVPVEMSFDGAGFLRYEDDDFGADKNSEYPNSRNSGERSVNTNQDRNRAMDDFRKVFNASRERPQNQIKFDDETSYQNENPDFGAQGAENGTPLAVDFMSAYQNAFQNTYQNAMLGNNQQFNYAPAQPSHAPQVAAFDPFSFTYPNVFGGQTNANQMMPQTMQENSFMQNHRAQPLVNPSTITPPAMYPPVPQQAFASNPMYAPQNPNSQQNHKIQRRKRSIINPKNGEVDAASSASHLTQDHYRYSRVDDQQDSSSGFIPITGSFNGGSIQLNFPFYGQSPISPSNYPARQQIHPSYSMPIRPEGRQYGGSVDNFYHPSEARRYSYGILGSGNFEVIRGGLFPGERQQSFHGGYQSGRIPYGGGSEEWNGNNYGTTEIIIDGPIQGFQGFDNFPAHLINALSKHSQIAVRPDRRDSG